MIKLISNMFTFSSFYTHTKYEATIITLTSFFKNLGI